MIVVPPESLSPTPSTPENKLVDSDYHTPADERHIQVDTSLTSCAAQL